MFFVRRAVARWTLGRVLEKLARYETQDFIAIEWYKRVATLFYNRLRELKRLTRSTRSPASAFGSLLIDHLLD